MNVVKTKKRNRMKLPLLNGILLIKYGLRLNNKTCYNYDLPEEVLLQIGSSYKYFKNVEANDSNNVTLYFEENENNENDDSLDF